MAKQQKTLVSAEVYKKKVEMEQDFLKWLEYKSHDEARRLAQENISAQYEIDPNER